MSQDAAFHQRRRNTGVRSVPSDARKGQESDSSSERNRSVSCDRGQSTLSHAENLGLDLSAGSGKDEPSLGRSWSLPDSEVDRCLPLPILSPAAIRDVS